MLISARSFYEPTVAPNTVSFGFSATAMHWLSQCPGPLNGHVHVLSNDSDALARFTAQALSDWTRILALRSRELRVGGRLLTVNLSRDSKGLYLGHNGGETHHVFDQLHQIWHELMTEGLVSEVAYQKGTILNFYKSPEEFTAPLMDSNSEPYRNGLRLVDERTVYVRCPYRRRWNNDHDTATFAAGLMATIRSWSRHSSLPQPGRGRRRGVQRLQQRTLRSQSTEPRLRRTPPNDGAGGLMLASTQERSNVSVLAEHSSDHLSVFVVAELTNLQRPANGGLRLLNYADDAVCLADGRRLAGLMTNKHDLYGTGFAGGKIVARASDPRAVKDELINVTADLLHSLDGTMITGCDLNTSLEDMERLMALTPHVLAAVGSPIDASAATAHGTLGAAEAVLGRAECRGPRPGACSWLVPSAAPWPEPFSTMAGPCSASTWIPSVRPSQAPHRSSPMPPGGISISTCCCPAQSPD